jgi:hypothetical protein
MKWYGVYSHIGILVYALKLNNKRLLGANINYLKYSTFVKTVGRPSETENPEPNNTESSLVILSFDSYLST